MSAGAEWRCASCELTFADASENLAAVVMFEGRSYARQWRLCPKCASRVRRWAHDPMLDFHRVRLWTVASEEARRGDLIEPRTARNCQDCRHAELAPHGAAVVCHYTERARGDTIRFDGADWIEEEDIDPQHARQCSAFDVAGEPFPGRGRYREKM